MSIQRGRTRRARGAAGSVTVELVILAPIVGLLLAGVVLVGRVQGARADLEGAPRAAARDLSLARDPHAVLDMVRSDAEATVRSGAPTCRTLDFTADITGAEVTVTLSCHVDLQAAAVLPVPGSMTVSATATEVIDQYRERTRP